MNFTDSHEWIKKEGDIGIVGVTSYAQKELGDIVYVELPRLNHEIKKGEEVAVLESTKAAADVYSPISGKIVEVNIALKDSPDLINRLPETDGWIYKIKLKDPSELNGLMNLQDYQKLVSK